MNQNSTDSKIRGSNRLRRLSHCIVLALAASGSLSPSVVAAETVTTVRKALDSGELATLEFRNIGPYRGGRSTAVTGVAGEANTFYMGSTGGGVWKTVDGGLTWSNLSDGSFAVGSIGAIAVAPSDPNVVYVGTGSACPRGNVSPGDGMYRSTDAGETWTHIGLDDAGQIARIRVHPTDPDQVWVAVLGHIFGPNDQRGVFHTSDGGKSWDKVLFVSDRAGAVDLTVDPTNPRILMAAIWQTERKPWTLTSGGEDSGLYRSSDSGQSWEQIDSGLPAAPLGRIGVTISPADPDRVWALIEAEEGGLFRSEDGGKTFERINSDRNFLQRAWYYTHVFADPSDPDTVYILNVGMWRSIDGGVSFTYISGPHGDHHDLWIDPADPDIMINGNDGGATVTYTGGETWSTQGNQPTAEMYRVAVDQQIPYRVYGCQQDNSCVSVPSRSRGRSIERQDWWVIGGCESGHVAIDPSDPNITYAGCYGGQISRHDHETGQDRQINAYPQLAIGQAPSDLKYRFQWNAPIRVSPHDPDILYHASQVLHRTQNEGHEWEVISPDLSSNDKERQIYAGGPLTLDNTGVEVYGTVFAFEESPQTPGLLWAGTDDGRVHLSRDGGASWAEITPAQMPERSQVNMIELSSHNPGRAFIAVTRYKFDDFTPYLFRTDDFGVTWQRIADGTHGIPDTSFTRVVREDPERQGLLFAGTEFGLYVSLDDGEHWDPFQLNLPATPITDLAITQGDLVIATQGRSFWIFDALEVLRQLDDAIVATQAHLFTPASALRYGGGSSFGAKTPSGSNPLYGAAIYYWLAEEPEEEIVLEVLDADGTVLRRLSNLEDERRAPDPWRNLRTDKPPVLRLPASSGINRYVWDLRIQDPKLVDDAVIWGSGRGPKVAPGEYRIRLTIGDWTSIEPLAVVMDPAVDASPEDLLAQYELSREIWGSINESHETLARLRDARHQVAELAQRLEAAGYGDRIEAVADRIETSFSELEAEIYQGLSEAPQDILNFPPRLDAQLLELLDVVQSADARPTTGTEQRYADVLAELRQIVASADSSIDRELKEFNALVSELRVPAVFVPQS